MTETALAHPPAARPDWLPPGAHAPCARTVLLVEDSRHAAEAVRLAVRRLGLRLRRADSLALARGHLRVYRPDVLLVDLGLPDGSGLELIAETAGAGGRAPRVVALSADPDGRAQALAAGATAFVAKPLHLPQDLGALLGEGLGAVPAAVLPDVGAGPNAGADPLALVDDLRTARRLLALPGEGARDHALRFAAGLARCAGDAALAAAVAEAHRTGRLEGLEALLDRRGAGLGGL